MRVSRCDQPMPAGRVSASDTFFEICYLSSADTTGRRVRSIGRNGVWGPTSTFLVNFEKPSFLDVLANFEKWFLKKNIKFEKTP